MNLSPKAITEFKEIYKNIFGIVLSDVEANSKGIELLEIFQNLSKPIPNEDESYLRSLDEDFGLLNQSMYNLIETVNN